jgi:hypothetical protein
MILLTVASFFAHPPPGKSNRNPEIEPAFKPPAMKSGIIFSLTLISLLCACFAGCTTLTGTDASPAMVPATTRVVEPTIAPVVVTPFTTLPAFEPVRPLPPERQVSLALTKDRPTSEIHLLYQGGPGDIFVTRVMMRVYSSDASYQEYIMSNGKKPVLNDEIVAPGTRQPDRCEVFVISSGTRTKVMDEKVVGGGYY